MTASIHRPAAEILDLAGTWRQQIDPANAGRIERWHTRDLSGSMKLPGSLEENHIGDAVSIDTRWTGGIFDKSYFTAPEYALYRAAGNIKVPFWLQPETNYVGPAWFQRDVEISSAWSGKHVSLTLERPHWKTSAWLDGRELGTRDSISVAHRYDIGNGLRPGRHTLTIRVDNSLQPDIGENSHSVSDHTQGNWNGIAGRIELIATATAWIEDMQVYPHVADRTVIVRGRVAGASGTALPGTVRLAGMKAASPPVDVPVAEDGAFSATCVFGANAALWDEFTPALHHLSASLPNGETAEVAFGFRAMAAAGRQLTINGRKLFLRGTLDCAAFPRTGHPPTDVAAWKREFSVIKTHGLNHVRFHSWCPPEAAFAAADELGLYLQVEVASWPNWSTTLGDGKPVDGWIDAETSRILTAYGNHASFTMLCACNEPAGDNHVSWLAAWNRRQMARDARRLYTAGAGWPEIPENDFHLRSEPRIQHWTEGLASRINRLPPETRSDYTAFINERAAPVVSHEIGQWCAYPDFSGTLKYTGYLKPRNFEIFRASLEAHGLGGHAHEFLIASGKLQALCYKEEIESALRTPSMGGFQLLGLADFPGQGTALVGVLDPFWEEKGYITPEAFSRFCDSTVVLARFDQRVFTADESLVADVEVAHYGSGPMSSITAGWQLVDDAGHDVVRGTFEPCHIAIGAANGLGHIDLPLANVPVPARYTFIVSLEGTTVANDWDIWVYPIEKDATTITPPRVTIASSLDSATEARLAEGGTVFLTIPPKDVAPDPSRGPIALGFSSIFWNTAWTHGQTPHTLGLLCDPTHPALAHFPTDSHSNWQWWYAVTQASPMILDDLPRELRPIVQVIDDWFTNRKLALAFEARVGKGRILVTSINLDDAGLDPVRRQLRASLLTYAGSSQFLPTVALTATQLRRVTTRQ